MSVPSDAGLRHVTPLGRPMGDMSNGWRSCSDTLGKDVTHHLFRNERRSPGV